MLLLLLLLLASPQSLCGYETPYQAPKPDPLCKQRNTTTTKCATKQIHATNSPPVSSTALINMDVLGPVWYNLEPIPIDGIPAVDNHAVAISGDVGVVGSSFPIDGDDDGAAGFGVAWIVVAAPIKATHQLDKPTPHLPRPWHRVAKLYDDILLSAPGTTAHIGFGSSVAISGKLAVVGAPAANGGAGAAYAFRPTTGNVRGEWSLVAVLEPPSSLPGVTPYDFADVNCLSVHGNNVVLAGRVSGTTAGAFVFKIPPASPSISGAGHQHPPRKVARPTGVRLGGLAASPSEQCLTTTSGLVKPSVALAGKTAVLGVTNTLRSSGGCAVAYELEGDTWVPTTALLDAVSEARLVKTIPTASSNFGVSVATNGNTILVADSAASSSGAVFAFEAHRHGSKGGRSGTIVEWQFSDLLVPAPYEHVNSFGARVYMDGPVAAIGSEDVRCFVFARQPGPGKWMQAAQYSLPNSPSLVAGAISGTNLIMVQHGGGGTAPVVTVQAYRATMEAYSLQVSASVDQPNAEFDIVAVASSDTTAVVVGSAVVATTGGDDGEYNDDSSDNNAASLALLYTFDAATASWQHDSSNGTLVLAATSADRVVHSVALDGDVMAFGMLPKHAVGPSSHVTVFRRTPTSSPAWRQVASLTAANSVAVHATFGTSLALLASTGELLVGSPYDSGILDPAARVYVYNEFGSATGGPQVIQCNVTEVGHCKYFGVALAATETTMFVGAPYEGAGTVVVYQRSSAAAPWPQQATRRLQPIDAANPVSQFGVSVALAGSTALVGAGGSSESAAYSAGAAYVFECTPVGVAMCGWDQTMKLRPSDGVHGKGFGNAVALVTPPPRPPSLAGGVAPIDTAAPLPVAIVGANITGAAYAFSPLGPRPADIDGPTYLPWLQIGRLAPQSGFKSFGSSLAFGPDGSVMVGARRRVAVARMAALGDGLFPGMPVEEALLASNCVRGSYTAAGACPGIQLSGGIETQYLGNNALWRVGPMQWNLGSPLFLLGLSSDAVSAGGCGAATKPTASPISRVRTSHLNTLGFPLGARHVSFSPLPAAAAALSAAASPSTARSSPDGGMFVVSPCPASRSAAQALILDSSETTMLAFVGCELQGGMARRGGAVAAFGGRVVMLASHVHHNVASTGGAFFADLKAELYMHASTLEHNNATLLHGGAIGFEDAKAVISASWLLSNTAGVGGGAVRAGDFSTLALRCSHLNDNVAVEQDGGAVQVSARAQAVIGGSTECLHNKAGRRGGAVANDGGSLLIVDAHFRSNTAVVEGGGVSCMFGGNLTLQRSTVDINAAGRSGGGVFSNGCSLDLLQGTFVTSNSAPTSPVTLWLTGAEGGCDVFAAAANTDASWLPLHKAQLAGGAGAAAADPWSIVAEPEPAEVASMPTTPRVVVAAGATVGHSDAELMATAADYDDDAADDGDGSGGHPMKPYTHRDMPVMVLVTTGVDCSGSMDAAASCASADVNAGIEVQEDATVRGVVMWVNRQPRLPPSWNGTAPLASMAVQLTAPERVLPPSHTRSVAPVQAHKLVVELRDKYNHRSRPLVGDAVQLSVQRYTGGCDVGEVECLLREELERAAGGGGGAETKSAADPTAAYLVGAEPAVFSHNWTAVFSSVEVHAHPGSTVLVTASLTPERGVSPMHFLMAIDPCPAFYGVSTSDPTRCVPCPPGHYSDAATDEPVTTACHRKCAETEWGKAGVMCGNGAVTVLPGYWFNRGNGTELEHIQRGRKWVYRCEDSEACTGNGMCKEHHHGPLCGECEVTNTMTYFKSAGTCEKCDTGGIARYLAVGITVMAIVYGVAFLGVTWSKKAKAAVPFLKILINYIQVRLQQWRNNRLLCVTANTCASCCCLVCADTRCWAGWRCWTLCGGQGLATSCTGCARHWPRQCTSPTSCGAWEWSTPQPGCSSRCGSSLALRLPSTGLWPGNSTSCGS